MYPFLQVGFGSRSNAKKLLDPAPKNHRILTTADLDNNVYIFQGYNYPHHILALKLLLSCRLPTDQVCTGVYWYELVCTDMYFCCYKEAGKGFARHSHSPTNQIWEYTPWCRYGCSEGR